MIGTAVQWKSCDGMEASENPSGAIRLAPDMDDVIDILNGTLDQEPAVADNQQAVCIKDVSHHDGVGYGRDVRNALKFAPASLASQDASVKCFVAAHGGNDSGKLRYREGRQLPFVKRAQCSLSVPKWTLGGVQSSMLKSGIVTPRIFRFLMIVRSAMPAKSSPMAGSASYHFTIAFAQAMANTVPISGA